MKKSSRVTKNTSEYMIFLKKEGLSGSYEAHSCPNRTNGNKASEQAELKLNVNVLHVWGRWGHVHQPQLSPCVGGGTEVAQTTCCETQLGLDGISNDSGTVRWEIPEPADQKRVVFALLFILGAQTKAISPLLDGMPSNDSISDRFHCLPGRQRWLHHQHQLAPKLW